LSGPGAVPLLSVTIPSWRTLWEAYVYITRSGPDSSVVSMVLLFLKVLLGSGRFGVLGALCEKLEDAMIVGFHLFVDSPLYLFVFWHVFVVALIFFSNSCIIGVVAIY
jgi:hypothetical protein